MKKYPKLKKMILSGLLFLILFFYLTFYGLRALIGIINPGPIFYLNKYIGMTGLFLIHFIVFGLFFLALQIKFKFDWKSQGVFLAFIFSLFAEMFGLPLFIFIVSPLISPKNMYFSRLIRPIYGTGTSPLFFGHVSIFKFIGSLIILSSLFLISLCWHQLFKNKESIASVGIYSKVRHPQYLGFMGFTFGWLLFWPTFISLILWPILTYLYIRQSLKEERDLEKRFGEAYKKYKSKTGMFLPKLNTN